MDDDQNKYDELIQKAYEKAPPYVREYVSSADFENFLKGLQVRFKLPAETASAAAFEITLALLGFTPPKNLPAYLEADARVPEETMDALMAALEEEVFGPLLKRAAPAGERKDAPVVAAPAPINRLSNVPAPAKPPVPIPPVPAPVLAPPSPAPVASAKPPAPKPFGTDVSAPIVKPAAPVTPPVVAPAPLAPVKTRPGETGASLPPRSASAPGTIDPYREVPE